MQYHLSNNAGGVKQLLTVTYPCPRKSALSLSLKMCRSNRSSLAISIQARNIAA
jgi:hypothetical protein